MRDDRGQDLIEFGLLMAAIVIIAIAVVSVFGRQIDSLWHNTVTWLGPKTPSATSTPSVAAGTITATLPVTIPAIVSLPPRPVIGSEQFEAEWPAKMQQKRSDTVRLTLKYPPGQHPVATIEVAGHAAELATPVPLDPAVAEWIAENGTKHHRFAVASLDAPGCEVNPAGEQEYPLLQGQTVTWIWTVSPTGSAGQVMTLRVRARWKSPGDDKGLVEYPLYYKRLAYQVEVAPAEYARPLDLTALAEDVGKIALGAALALIGQWVVRFLRTRVSKRPARKGISLIERLRDRTD